MTATEEWRAVVGLEGRYEVSDAGRVRSLDRAKAWPPSRRHPRGHIGVVPGKTLGLFTCSRGYVAFKVDGRNWKVHHVVAAAFIGPRPADRLVRHLNDIKRDNRASNLAYGTMADNGRDGARNDAYAHGAAHYATKLTAEDAAAIKGLRGVVSQSRVARRVGIRQSCVSEIMTGKTWARVPAMDAVASTVWWNARRELERRRGAGL